MHVSRSTSIIALCIVMLVSFVLTESSGAQSAESAEYTTYLPYVTRPVTYDEPVGIYDEVFGTQGMVSTGFPGGGDDGAKALALQPDGKILAAGYAFNGSDYDFALVRYLPDGAVDATFDGDGWLVTDFGGRDEARAVALQPDGKIILAGYTDAGGNFDFALVRYLANGKLDISFDQDGRVTSDFFGGHDSAYDLALQPDGGILVAGYTYESTTSDLALARYLPDGSLDVSFGGTGWVSLDFAGYGDQGFGVALQPDGKILVAGAAILGTDVSDFALVRYLPDGALDAEFDGDGWLLTDFSGNYDSGTALALQPDGKIVVVGDSGGDVGVARYLSDGALDLEFSEDGLLLVDFYGLRSSGNAVLLQPDGKIILAGTIHFCNENDFVMARLTAGGNLDRNFDGDGMLLSYIVDVTDFGNALLQQPDGELVVAGLIDNSSDDDFLLARFR